MRLFGRIVGNIIVEVYNDEEAIAFPHGFLVEIPDNAQLNDALYEGILYPRPAFGYSFDMESKTWVVDENAKLAWSAEQLKRTKDLKIAAVDARTRELILAGFDFQVPEGTLAEIDGEQVDVGGETYHFNFDADDRSNFTDGALAYTLAMQTGNASFRRGWRGWQGDKPFVLSFTASDFIALVTFAKMDHMEGRLVSGWPITDAIRAATTIEELDAIVDDRK